MRIDDRLPQRPDIEVLTDRQFRELITFWCRASRDGRTVVDPAWRRSPQPTSRPRIPAEVRAAVIARDGDVCQLCRRRVAADDVHLDHVVPWSAGGRHVIDNLRVTHSTCNLRRGARTT